MRSVLLSLLVVVVGSVSGACTAGPGEAPTSSVAPSTTTTIPVTSAPTATTSIAPSTTTTIPVTSAPTTTTLPPSPSFENLGLAASWVVQLDDGVAFGVNESEQGFDLSGDGDTDDVVVHVVSDATVVNTGLQARWGVVPIAGGGFVVQVSERDLGADLNGDGDAVDTVPSTWNADDGAASLGMAAWVTPGPDGSLWLESPGPDAQTLRVLRSDGRLIDTGWIATSVQPRDDGTALIGVSEREQGRDLNGDGTLTEHVLVLWAERHPAEVIGPAYVYDSTTDGGVWLAWDERDEQGRVQSWHLGFWHRDTYFVDLPIATVNHTAMPNGGLIFGVSETTDYWSYSYECNQGGQDLNGDGDCADFILHRWSPASGLVSLGLIQQGWCPECEWGYVTSGDVAWASQREWEMGQDLDGDGEVTDASVLHVVEGDAVHNLGVRVSWDTRRWAALDGGAVVLVEEATRDLNDDADVADGVFHFVPNTGAAINIGLGGGSAQALSTGEVVLLAEEAGNGRDFNGDGYISDDTYVIHIWSPQRGLTNTGLTNGRYMDEEGPARPYLVGTLPDRELVALVPEWQQGDGDLNGDGDTNDVVVHVVSM